MHVLLDFGAKKAVPTKGIEKNAFKSARLHGRTRIRVADR